MVSLKRCGTSRRRSPRRSGVWYRETRICEVKRRSSGSSMVLELTRPVWEGNQREAGWGEAVWRGLTGDKQCCWREKRTSGASAVVQQHRHLQITSLRPLQSLLHAVHLQDNKHRAKFSSGGSQKWHGILQKWAHFLCGEHEGWIQQLNTTIWSLFRSHTTMVEK